MPLHRRLFALWPDAALVAALLAPFLVLKAYGLNPAVSDENIYFYDAVLMTQGVWPYRDFFFAHPPLHLIPGWLLFSVTGFDLTTAKMLPVVAATATGLLVYVAGRLAAGRAAGAVAALLLLFAHDYLRASSHWTGVNWSVAWATAGLLCALRGRVAASGVLYALGATTGFYVFPGALMTGTLLAVARGRAALRFAAAFAIPFLAINAAFWAFGGDGYLDAVYRYHFMKPGEKGEALVTQSWALLHHNFFLLAGPLYLAPGLATTLVNHLTQRGASLASHFRSALDPERSGALAVGLWCVLYSAGYVAFLALLSTVYHFYFLLLFPTCAIAGGLFAADLGRAALAAVRGPRAGASAVAAGVMMAVLLAGFLLYPTFEHKRDYWTRSHGKSSRYEFPRAPLPGWLHRVVEAVWWSPTRTVGERHSGVLYYLWHESRDFRDVHEIAARLRIAREPRDAMFGDSTTAPLVALLSGVPIALHEVDTNAMRFRSGITPAEDLITRLAATYGQPSGALRFALLGPDRGFYRVRSFQDFVTRDFETHAEFRTRHFGTYRLVRRRAPPGG